MDENVSFRTHLLYHWLGEDKVGSRLTGFSSKLIKNKSFGRRDKLCS